MGSSNGERKARTSCRLLHHHINPLMMSESKGYTSGVVSLAENYPGFELRHVSGSSSVVIANNGATVISWKILGQEILFLSPRHILTKGKAVRGGIPVVFPQFGPGALPQHGFARNKDWALGETSINKATGDIATKFHLTEDEETLKVWPYKFELILTVKLHATALSQQLTVINKETEKSFEFTALLHTYLAVDNIQQVNIYGLKGINYIDKVDQGANKSQDNEAITFQGDVERVYVNGAAQSLRINDGGNAEILIKATGFNDFVVWNPWSAKAGATADLGEENYPKFVCVEAGTVAEPQPLKPGQTWYILLILDFLSITNS
jgi:glucose-6-phosphate 1-epimerase